jgi:hypothetical protein
LRICRKAYYYFIATLAITYIPSGANEFCAIDRKVLNSVLATNDQKPYVRGLIHLTGSPTKYISYEKRKRLSGRSKENFRTYLDIAINAFISTSTLFPRLLILIGLFVSFLSFLVGFAAVFLTVINSGWGAILETGNLIWGLFFVSGLQIFFLGFVSEYIVSINQQVRPKPKSFFVESDD